MTARTHGFSSPRNDDRLAGRLAATLGILLVSCATLAAQDAIPKALKNVRTLHITGLAEMIGADRQIGTCLMEKLKAQGPFTFADSSTDADAVITWTANITEGAARHYFGQAPSIKAELKTPDGKLLWKGENKFRKSTTLWGSGADIPCGLADGLVKKLVAAMQKGT